MEISMQNDLCKGLRACGTPKEQCHEILNEVIKWYDSCGPDWTNDRIKAMRQWYETCLAGKPVPPDWCKHSPEGYPRGIWKWVFDQKPGKALGILSMNTVLYNDHLTEPQMEKFQKGLSGNQSYGDISEMVQILYTLPDVYLDFAPYEMPPIHFPTLFDMTGSVPVDEGHSSVHPKERLGVSLKALQLSWKSCPQVTLDFLDEMDLLGYLPEQILFREDHETFRLLEGDTAVGRVTALQQPQLKARWIGNPNRVMQATLDPLKSVLSQITQRLITDVTFDQPSGVAWVQRMLKDGYCLAGSDLTSASDLLEIGRCLDLIDAAFGVREIPDYLQYEEYYRKVCKSEWWCPELDRTVQWEQGTVLGTGPSFFVLTLTNNLCGMVGYIQAVRQGAISPDEWIRNAGVFRALGDDIIMDSRILPYYEDCIARLGGEINRSKTLVSDKVAEFAGRIVTADASWLKAIKYCEPSDNSFMEVMAQLGSQAKFLLKPKQRKVWELFKEVPGVAVNGPWMPDSYGVPLSERYLWYLQEVEPVLKTADPDLQLSSYDFQLLRAQLSRAEASETDIPGFDTPVMPDEGYLPSQVTPAFKPGGDPRLSKGKSTLDVLYKHVIEGDITPFTEWRRTYYGDVGNPDSSGMEPSVEATGRLDDDPRVITSPEVAPGVNQEPIRDTTDRTSGSEQGSCKPRSKPSRHHKDSGLDR